MLKKISSLFPGGARIWSMLPRAYNKARVFFARGNVNTRYFWDNKLSKFDTFWRNENYQHILDLFPEDREFSLLDVGCAIGDGCELIQKKFSKAKITGVDISRVGIKKAAQKTKRIDYRVLNILKDKLPDSYDFISIIETLEHFDHPFSILDKCLKHVRKSIIVSVPFTPGYTGRVNFGEHRYSFNEKTFVNTKYKYRIAKITDHVKVTDSKCIIYEFFPHT